MVKYKIQEHWKLPKIAKILNSNLLQKYAQCGRIVTEDLH